MVPSVCAAAYAVFRPLLGPDQVCIYHVSCSEYAKAILGQKPLYKSIPLITLRLLSCNPLTALIFNLRYKKS